MKKKKKIVGICGSASINSGNLSILKYIVEQKKSEFDFEIVDDLADLPHFSADLVDNNVPQKVIDFRNKINGADGIIICTPEYVFSIPSRLKNALEWCVSTTVFSDKPIGLITASTSGEKGHEEIKLIMKTLQTDFTDATTLLIRGVKGKLSKDGNIIDDKTEGELRTLIQSFRKLVIK